MTDQTASEPSTTTPSSTKPSASTPSSTEQMVTVRHSETTPGLVHVQLHRPGKLNSLTLDTLNQLVATAHKLRRDRSVRAVILSGFEHNFSAGLDFASALKTPGRIATTFLPRPWRGTNTFQEAPWAWRRLPVPVIAAVEGYCFGGGVQIALAADYRFTTPDAQWSVLEAKWGLIPDMSGIMTMKQVLPIDIMKRLTMSGEVISGKQAVEYGLASEVADDPLAAAEELARQIITRSPDSVAYAKRVIDETWESGPRMTFLKERLRQARLLAAKNTRIAQKAAAKKIPAEKIAETFRRREVR